MTKKKPDVLSAEFIAIKVWDMARAGPKLGYSPYKDNMVRQETLKWAIGSIYQAQQQTAREIFEEIEGLSEQRRRTSKHVVNYITINHKNWDKLKSKFLKENKE